MKTISVKAVKRAEFGKKAAKAIRREGLVPCVLCGNGETETFSVDPREIKPLIYTPNSYIVEFDFEGKKEQAVLREAQFHPPYARRSSTWISTASPRASPYRSPFRYA